MTDMLDTQTRDDAPLTTSTNSDATEELVEGKGTALSGKTVTINRPREELFAYWRDFADLATFMDNVERVEVLDDKRSHWVVSAPAGRTVEWDAVITEEVPGEVIAWASAEDADVPNSGRIDFRDATGGRGTTVTATRTGSIRPS